MPKVYVKDIPKISKTKKGRYVLYKKKKVSVLNNLIDDKDLLKLLMTSFKKYIKILNKRPRKRKGKAVKKTDPMLEPVTGSNKVTELKKPSLFDIVNTLKPNTLAITAKKRKMIMNCNYN